MWLWYINKIGAFACVTSMYVEFKITSKKGNLFSMTQRIITNASEDIYIFYLCNSIKLANRFFNDLLNI